MTRFNQLPDQYLDDAGAPLVKGKIQFQVSGGGTDKDTFADQDETIANTNPVILSASGIPPNIFFTGEVKAILLDSNDQQIRVLDPLPGSSSALDAFSNFSATITYSQEDIARGSNERYFKSITNNNIGNDPTTTTGFWIEINFVHTFNIAYTFQIDYVTVASDSNLYISRVANNVGNDPVSSPTEWKILTQTGSVAGPASSTDNALARFDTTTGLLIQNSVAILDDSGNLSGIGTLGSGTHTIASGSDLTISEGKIALTSTVNETTFLLTSSATNAIPFDLQTQATGNFIGNIQTGASSGTLLGLKILFSGSAPDDNSSQFVVYDDNVTTRAQHFADGDWANHDGVYGTISDRKLKTDLASVRSYWGDFKSLNYQKYRMKTDIEQYGSDCAMRIGLIHDEVKNIFPGCAPESPDTRTVVTGNEQVLRTKVVKGLKVPDLDEGGNAQFDDGRDITEVQSIVDDDGVQISTGWVKSSVIEGPILAIVLQEAMAKIEALEEKVTALEAV